MNQLRETYARLGGRATRAAIAVAAALLLVSGAAWRGFAADAQTPNHSTTITTPTPTIAHAVAGARDSYADVVKVVAPAVVTIRTEGKAKVSPTDFQDDQDVPDFFRRFFGQPFENPHANPHGGQGNPHGDQFDNPHGMRSPHSFKQRALGSGVIVSPDGYILTNEHVVDGADDIRVELTDDRTFTAKLVGSDKPSDLALLKIEATSLQVLPLGNSDAVQVGDVVLAVGNPLGIGQTVTMGIISAKGRSTGVGDGSYEDFLQTDAPINHGNSGGALVNTRGELVGINSQILSTSDGNIGIGFAIPANMARHVMDDLRKDGRVRRAQLGVTVQPVTSDMAENLGLKQVSGAIVSNVSPGSAADHAGIRRGDVIESFNGRAVHDTNTLRNRVADAEPGSKATVLVMRDGSEKTLSVKLDEAAVDRNARAGSDSDNESDAASLGVAVEPLTPELAKELGVKDVHGVVVQQVNPDGRAADAGIQPGDVIQEVNRQPVHGVDELRAAVRKTTDKPLLLLVNRKGTNLFVTVRPANG